MVQGGLTFTPDTDKLMIAQPNARPAVQLTPRSLSHTAQVPNGLTTLVLCVTSPCRPAEQVNPVGVLTPAVSGQLPRP